MKIHTFIAILCISLYAFCSCSEPKEDPEQPAQEVLNEVRSLMMQKNYNAAKDSIRALRKRFPRALKTRKEAIITLDSIELLAARDSAADYAISLQAEKDAFATMKPFVNGKTNEAYYAQQRLLFDMNNHYDELCTKEKFFIRKIEEDLKK